MQTKLMSAIETAASTTIGYVVATLTNFFVLPWFGFSVSMQDSAAIAVIFTVVSLLRGYGVRRLFNWIHHK